MQFKKIIIKERTKDERQRVTEGGLAPHQPRGVYGLRRAVDVPAAHPRRCNIHTGSLPTLTHHQLTSQCERTPHPHRRTAMCPPDSKENSFGSFDADIVCVHRNTDMLLLKRRPE